MPYSTSPVIRATGATMRFTVPASTVLNPPQTYTSGGGSALLFYNAVAALCMVNFQAGSAPTPASFPSSGAMSTGILLPVGQVIIPFGMYPTGTAIYFSFATSTAATEIFITQVASDN